jgi:hypothetical protein
VPATGQKQVWLSVRSEATIERLESCPDPVRQGLGVTLPLVWALVPTKSPERDGSSPQRSLGRVIRAARLLVRDPRVPRPLRWLLAISLLPIPGPFDEVVLVLVAPLLLTFHRDAMREAWRDRA